MKDILDLTDTELIEMVVNKPDELDKLVKESKIEFKELAEAFVNRPFLQESILKYNDPTELYNIVSEKIDSKGNVKDEEYKNLMYALKSIKKYVLENSKYNKEPIADTLRGISVEIEDEPQGTSLISSAEHDELIELGLDEIEIRNLPNYNNEMIVSILERCPGSYYPVIIALEKHGILVDNQELINELVYRIENPSYDTDYGEEEVKGYKRVLEEMGTSYEEIKDYEREDFEDYCRQLIENSFTDFLEKNKNKTLYI